MQKSKFSKQRYRKFEKKTSGSLIYWHTSVFITSKNRLFLLVFRHITKIEKIIWNWFTGSSGQVITSSPLNQKGAHYAPCPLLEDEWNSIIHPENSQKMQVDLIRRQISSSSWRAEQLGSWLFVLNKENLWVWS